MARKPSDEDLLEIAAWLDDVHPGSEVYPAAKRVARWLEQSVRGERPKRATNTQHPPC